MNANFLRKEVEFKREVDQKNPDYKSETLTVTIEFVSNGDTSLISNEEILKRLLDKIADEI